MTGLNIQTLATSLRDRDRQFSLSLSDLSIESSEIVALTGASGAGKTLALELLGLLRAPDEGASYCLQKDGTQTHLDQLWQHGPRGRSLSQTRGRVFGFVPQSGGLAPFLTVQENVELPQMIGAKTDLRWLNELFDILGLLPVLDMSPNDLSIGQRQRTAIARALSHKPDFVIADEPTSALDPETADGVLELFMSAVKELNCAVIMSSHDITRIERFGLRRWHISTSGNGHQVNARVDVLPAGSPC